MLLDTAEYFLPAECRDGSAPVPDSLAHLGTGRDGNGAKVLARTEEVGRASHGNCLEVLVNDPYAAACEVPGDAADQLVLEHRRIVPGRLDCGVRNGFGDRSDADQEKSGHVRGAVIARALSAADLQSNAYITGWAAPAMIDYPRATYINRRYRAGDLMPAATGRCSVDAAGCAGGIENSRHAQVDIGLSCSPIADADPHRPPALPGRGAAPASPIALDGRHHRIRCARVAKINDHLVEPYVVQDFDSCR